MTMEVDSLSKKEKKKAKKEKENQDVGQVQVSHPVSISIVSLPCQRP